MARNELAVVRTEVDALTPQFSRALPAHIKSEKFARVLVTAIGANNDLLNPELRTSLYAASMKAAQDGLLPDGREAALVVFKSKTGPVVQYMRMVGGILKMLRNSGQLKSIATHVVFEKDEFSFHVDNEGEHLIHRPNMFEDRGEILGVYAHAATLDGGTYIEVMSYREVEKVRAASRSPDRGPWFDWWDEMAKKTVLRRISKRLPSSSDLDLNDDEPQQQARTQEEPERREYDVTSMAEPEPEKPKLRGIQNIAAKRASAGETLDQEMPPPDDAPPADEEDFSNVPI